MSGKRASARLAALAAAALLTACGAGEEAETVTVTETETVVETETVTTAPEEDAEPDELAQACENDADAYAVRYPAGWHVNAGGVAPRCSYFHPEPFDVPEATEAPPVAISIYREPVAFGDVAGANPGIDIHVSEETEVAGRTAIRREIESTGEALLPAGILGYEYLVDLGGETLIVSTRDFDGLDFERNREILDRMVETLELR